MSITVVTTLQQLEALRARWNALLRCTETNVVHLTHEWIVSWWKSFGSRERLHTVLVSDANNELIGIIPLMVSESRYRSIEVRKLCLIANGHTPSSDIIAPTGRLGEVVSALFGHMRALNEWDMLDLNKMSRTSPSCEHILRHLDSRYTYGIKENIESPFVVVNTDWATFLGRRSQKFRKVLRNKINRANRAGDLHYEKITITSGSHPALDDMIRISSRSWKSSIREDLKSNPESRQFHHLLADSLGPQGMVHLWLLKKGNLPVAFEYHLAYNNVSYPIRADYDEAFREISPGSLLEYQILNTLFRESVSWQYYSCADNYEYLRNWTDTTRKHINIEIFNRKTIIQGLHTIEYEVLPMLRKFNLHKIRNYLLPDYGRDAAPCPRRYDHR